MKCVRVSIFVQTTLPMWLKTANGTAQLAEWEIHVLMWLLCSAFSFYLDSVFSLRIAIPFFFQYNLDRTLLMLSNVYGWRLWNSLSFHSIESERKKYSTLIGSSTGAILSIQRWHDFTIGHVTERYHSEHWEIDFSPIKRNTFAHANK